MKIDSIHLINMHNDAHFQYFTEYCALVTSYEANRLKIEQQHNALAALIEEEDKALKKIRKSMYTADMKSEDKHRDELWTGITGVIRAALKHFDSDVIRAAEKLKIIADTYGNVTVKPYEEETSAIYNFIQDVREKCSSEITAITGFEGWINELDAANKSFEILMMKRYDEMAEKSALNLREIRLKADQAYHAVVDCITAHITLEGDEHYREFVVTLNAVIKRYTDAMSKRKGRAAARKEHKPE